MYYYRSMFGWIKKKPKNNNDELVKILASEMQGIAHTIRLDFQNRFEELKDDINNLNKSFKNLESQLLVKDLRDKQQYGQLHYKIHEVKSKKLENEIENLEVELKDKKLL
jgi:hypothetical protein